MGNFYCRELRRWIAIIPAICLGLMAFSQRQAYTIQGRITGAEGEPLLGATIQLPALQTGTVTDDDGRYVLNVNAPSGDYVMRVSYIGYLTSEKSVTLGAGNTVTMEEQL